MAAARVRFSLEYTVFRGLKFISRTRYNSNSISPKISASQLFHNNRYISTKSYLNKDRPETVSTNGSTVGEDKKLLNENEKRTDLERLKELLFQDKSTTMKSNVVEQELMKQQRPQLKKQEAKIESSVKVTQIADILSTLKVKPSEGDSQDISYKSSSHIEEKVDETTEQGHVVRSTHSVEAGKLRDALSILEQDTSTADEVIMAGQQISSDRSVIEGAYNIKQRQFQNRDIHKKMTRSSLKTGLRTHMFDKVREKWSHEDAVVHNSIFEEMAEKEVKDLGMSAEVQSGFHDLMDNIHRQWSFPVDNEVCKTDEELVSFDEHVFLEHLLVDFPKTGNIRQFMELVVTGLQQNPHLSVQEKIGHIEWFREYFQNMPEEQVQLL